MSEDTTKPSPTQEVAASAIADDVITTGQHQYCDTNNDGFTLMGCIRNVLVPRIAALLAERDALAKFKAYVHQRLDEAGVPVDPNSPHRAEGCRIGGRLDFVLAEYSAMQLERDSLARLIAAADGRVPPSPEPAPEQEPSHG